MTSVISNERLLICEGPEERALVEALTFHRGLQPFHVVCIDDFGTGGGITGLRHHLPKLLAIRGFRNVQHFCLLADNNGDHRNQLRVIQNEIKLANLSQNVKGYFPIPRSRFRKWRKGAITFTVILQPCDGMPGCLETVLWRVVSRLHGAEAACVDDLVQCARLHQDNWNISKIDKARIRTAIAILYRRNPAMTLTWLWKNAPNMIPVADPEFDNHFNYLNAI